MRLRVRSSLLAAVVLLGAQALALFLAELIGTVGTTFSGLGGKPMMMFLIGGVDRIAVTMALLLLCMTAAIVALRRCGILASTKPAPIEETFS